MFRGFRYPPRNRSKLLAMSTDGKLVVWDCRDTRQNPNPFYFWVSQESKAPSPNHQLTISGHGDTVDGSEILHHLGCIKPCK